MALIVILVCIGMQRYLKWNSYSRQLNWVDRYANWMISKFALVTQGNGYAGVALLLLPALLLLALVFAIVAHVLGDFGYFVLNAVLLWSCLDARDIKKEPYEINQPEELFILTYRRLFGVIFWFAVFGPVGLVLYHMVNGLRLYFQRQAQEGEYKALLETTGVVQGVLDWLPIRLLGLSFALVGHFSSVFKPWLNQLLEGIKDNAYQVADWGMVAASQTDDIVLLIDRSLLVWLVCIALFTIGYWLG